MQWEVALLLKSAATGSFGLFCSGCWKEGKSWAPDSKVAGISGMFSASPTRVGVNAPRSAAIVWGVVCAIERVLGRFLSRAC